MGHEFDILALLPQAKKILNVKKKKKVLTEHGRGSVLS